MTAIAPFHRIRGMRRRAHRHTSQGPVRLRPGRALATERSREEVDLCVLQEVALRMAAAWARTPWARWLAEPREDLEQVAFIGVWRAHQRFDPTRGSSYVNWLRIGASSEIRHHLRALNPVRIPRWMYEARPRVLRARDRLWAEHERQPALDDLAVFTHLPTNRVQEILRTTQAGLVKSLDALDREDQVYVSQRAAGDHDAMETRAVVIDALAHLPVRDRGIVLLYYGYRWRQHELARWFRLSERHVGRLLHQALSRLRSRLAIQ